MHMLRAQLMLWDMEITAAAIVRDDPAAACAFIEENADRSDLILTTGGASVGKKDIMHDVVRLLPTEQLFWKVRLKPGSPSIAALYGGKLLIALSGNPYGAIANLHLLVRPVLAIMAHRPDLSMQMRTAIYDTGFSKKSPVTRYVRGVYESGHVRSYESNESGVLASMIGCNCMIVVPAGDKGVEPGETVDILML
jgi:molybdopterin molybdotransferase